MTREELRKIDAEVAEKVMGHIVSQSNGMLGWWDGKRPSSFHEMPHYSTDIAAAWTVVERLRQKHWNFNLCCHHGTWTVLLDNQTVGDDIAEADTAPLAICLAALEASRQAKP